MGESGFSGGRAASQGGEQLLKGEGSYPQVEEQLLRRKAAFKENMGPLKRERGY
jgi:hypothetical protein